MNHIFMKLKYIFIIIICFFNYNKAFSQAKKPTIMVVPSDSWCSKNGFMVEYNVQGEIVKIPNYKKAFQESPELSGVISAIGKLMADRGFPLVSMEAELKKLQTENVEDEMLTSKSGANISESPLDKLRKNAKCDLWMQVDWTTNIRGPRMSVTYTLTGIDAYTSKSIAGGIPKTGNLLSTTDNVIDLLTTAILDDIDVFNASLMSYFDDMFTNGREIVIRVKKFDSWDGDFETEFDGKELGSYIEEWLTSNCVKGRYNTADATSNMMVFNQVRIPIYNETGVAIDARSFCKGLQNYLRKPPFSITNKLMTQGLGQATIVLGEK